MSDLTIEPEALEGVRRVTAGGGWTVELDFTWQEKPLLRLTSAPRGRGIKRDKWLIIGDGATMTHADCFRVLAECLDRIAAG